MATAYPYALQLEQRAGRMARYGKMEPPFPWPSDSHQQGELVYPEPQF
ncbi:hypothetical protein [Streptomyces sp. NPDC017993]